MESLNNYRYIVFAPEHYNTLGLIRSLGEQGIYPIYISIKSKYRIASRSRYISRCYYVDNQDEGYNLLLSLIQDSQTNNFVFTIDDKTESFLDNHYDELKDYCYFFNAGSSGQVSRYMDKYEILKAGSLCGLKTLPTIVIDKNSICPIDIEFPIITKSISPVIGGWKSDVHICNDYQELNDALKLIKSDKVLIQKYINKKNEYCLDGFSINQGKDLFIGIESTYRYNIPGYYSPYMTVSSFNNPENLLPKLSQLFKLIKFEGIFSIEFLIDQDNNYYFSEINFRNSTWNYASTKRGVNIPVLWAESTLNQRIINQKDILTKDFTAMVEPVDYQKRVIDRKYSLIKWIKDLFSCKCTYYWNWKDLRPSIYMVFNNKIFR